MNIARIALFCGVAAISGGAFACTEKALPPILVDMGLVDLDKARAAGYKNPAEAAFFGGVDDAGIMLVGESTWVNTAYKGYATSKVSIAGISNGTIIYIEKPCGKKAIDRSEKGGLIGGVSPGGGGIGSGGGYGVVGYRPVYRTAEVCTQTGCSVESILIGWEPIYGQTGGPYYAEK